MASKFVANGSKVFSITVPVKRLLVIIAPQAPRDCINYNFCTNGKLEVIGPLDKLVYLFLKSGAESASDSSSHRLLSAMDSRFPEVWSSKKSVCLPSCCSSTALLRLRFKLVKRLLCDSRKWS